MSSEAGLLSSPRRLSGLRQRRRRPACRRAHAARRGAHVREDSGSASSASGSAAVSGAMTLSKASDIDPLCENGICAPAAKDDLRQREHARERLDHRLHRRRRRRRRRCHRLPPAAASRRHARRLRAEAIKLTELKEPEGGRSPLDRLEQASEARSSDEAHGAASTRQPRHPSRGRGHGRRVRSARRHRRLHHRRLQGRALHPRRERRRHGPSTRTRASSLPTTAAFPVQARPRRPHPFASDHRDNAFCIDTTEVSNGQYDAFIAAKGDPKSQPPSVRVEHQLRVTRERRAGGDPNAPVRRRRLVRCARVLHVGRQVPLRQGRERQEDRPRHARRGSPTTRPISGCSRAPRRVAFATRTAACTTLGSATSPTSMPAARSPSGTAPGCIGGYQGLHDPRRERLGVVRRPVRRGRFPRGRRRRRRTRERQLPCSRAARSPTRARLIDCRLRDGEHPPGPPPEQRRLPLLRRLDDGAARARSEVSRKRGVRAEPGAGGSEESAELKRLGDVLHRRALPLAEREGRGSRGGPGWHPPSRGSTSLPAQPWRRAVLFIPLEKPVKLLFGLELTDEQRREVHALSRPRCRLRAGPRTRSAPAAGSSSWRMALAQRSARASRSFAGLVRVERRPEERDHAVADHLVEHAAVLPHELDGVAAPGLDELGDPRRCLQDCLRDSG